MDARGMHDGAAQGQALFQAAGQQPCDGGAPVDETRHAQHVFFALRTQMLGNVVNPAEEIDVLFHGEVVIERELLRHVADIPADLFRILGHVEARHRAPAGSGRQEAAEHADDGGLAGAVRPQETEDFALLHLEGNVVHGHEVAKGFDQVADFEGGAVLCGGGHWGLSVIGRPQKTLVCPTRAVRFLALGQAVVFCGLPCFLTAADFRIGFRSAVSFL
jgi:hypothetical protein